MKSPSARNIATAALLAGLLAGCGQTGPLYLPKPPAKPAPAASTPPPAPSLPVSPPSSTPAS